MTASPDEMRQAVAGYVEEIHRSYIAQALTFPPGVQGRMSLLAGFEGDPETDSGDGVAGAPPATRGLTAVAVGLRHLHLLATFDRWDHRRGRRCRSPARSTASGGICGSTTPSYCRHWA